MCETLLKAHIPYDVRVLEYPQEIEAERYRVFLVPLGTCLSDAGVDFLASAARARKAVLTFGPLGQRDENFMLRKGPLPAAFAAIQPVGVKLDDLLFPFNEEKQPAGAAELVRRICDTLGQPIRVNHPSATRLVATLVESDSGAILQVLNFNIPTFSKLPEYQQLTREQVVPAENVSIIVQMPSAAPIKTVRGLSPDHEPTAISFQQTGDSLSLVVPRVGVWESIFIDSAGH